MSAYASPLLVPALRFHARYPRGRFGLPIHHVESDQREGLPHFIDFLWCQGSPGLEKPPQTRHGNPPNIRSLKKHVINGGHASKCGAAEFSHRLEDFIWKHETPVKYHTTALVEMRLHHAGSETVAQGENQHSSFVAPQLLAANDRFGIGD